MVFFIFFGQEFFIYLLNNCGSLVKIKPCSAQRKELKTLLVKFIVSEFTNSWIKQTWYFVFLLKKIWYFVFMVQFEYKKVKVGGTIIEFFLYIFYAHKCEDNIFIKIYIIISWLSIFLNLFLTLCFQLLECHTYSQVMLLQMMFPIIW